MVALAALVRGVAVRVRVAVAIVRRVGCYYGGCENHFVSRRVM